MNSYEDRIAGMIHFLSQAPHVNLKEISEKTCLWDIDHASDFLAKLRLERERMPDEG